MCLVNARSDGQIALIFSPVVPLPRRYRLTQDPSSPARCLHCVDVLRYHISTIWRSSFCVDTHINYLDCLEHLSGLSTMLSIVPQSVRCY